MTQSKRLSIRLLAAALLFALAAPAIVRACMPASNGMEITMAPLDSTQELPGGG